MAVDNVRLIVAACLWMRSCLWAQDDDAVLLKAAAVYAHVVI